LTRGNVPLKETAIALQPNLWFLEEKGHCVASGRDLCGFLRAVRSEFEYSIIVAPTAEHSSAVVEAAQFSDGVVLVLSAMRTRRVNALKVKHSLEQAGVRLLGTVLADREFPIPQNLYRCL
jgi:Mrp family chromosome partitioning ATPase